MTIQIFELIVKTVIEDKQFKQKNYETSFNNTVKEELVSKCSEEVLRRLQHMNER